MGCIKTQCESTGLYTTNKVSFKKMELGKSHNANEEKTTGSVCNVILMKSCHERVKGTCDVWSSKWILCCCIHVIVCSGVLYAVETRKG